MTRDADAGAILRARVDASWPGLIPAHAAVRVTRGQSNDVLIVDDVLIFRFPRTSASAATLQTEVDLLLALQGRLSLPIPDPAFVTIGAGAPDAGFAGYPLLPGAPLTRESVSSCTRAEIARIAGQIAQFLEELHAIPATELPALPNADAPSDWSNLFAAFKADLFPSMRPDARADVAAAFAEFLDAAGDAGHSPVLRHGDLGGENIRYDASTNRVTGIIDFGSAAFGDPAIDLAALSWYGDAFADALADHCPALADSSVRSRAAFYRGTHALQQALWAIRAGDTADFEDGIRAYR